MRHRHTGPPLSVRVAGALSRGLAHTRHSAAGPARAAARHSARHSAGRPSGRPALLMGLITTVTGLLLAVPVLSSGSGTSPMALDSTSSTAVRSTEEPVPTGTDGNGGSSRPDSTDVAGDSPSPPAELPAAADAAAPGPVTDGTDAVPPAPLAEAAPAGDALVDPEAVVLASVNAARAGSGCEPLVHDEGLATVARAHSADMRDQSFFDHVNPAGLDPFDRARAAGQTNARAENIAVGQPSPAAVMDHWMASSGHRANVLDCSLRTLGVGVAEGPAGPWWTQLFGD